MSKREEFRVVWIFVGDHHGGGRQGGEVLAGGGDQRGVDPRLELGGGDLAQEARLAGGVFAGKLISI